MHFLQELKPRETLQKKLRCSKKVFSFANVIAFATPIYYYEMSGQMKTLLDRANPLYSSDYAFRDIYMLTAAAEDTPHVPRRAISGLQGWIDCFEKAALAGTVFAGGVNDPGAIDEHPALEKAYAMGITI